MKKILLFLSLLFISYLSFSQTSYIGKKRWDVEFSLMKQRGNMNLMMYNITDTFVMKENHYDTTFFYYFKYDVCVQKMTLIQFVDYLLIFEETSKGVNTRKIAKWIPKDPKDIKKILIARNCLNTKSDREFLRECSKEYDKYLKNKKLEKEKLKDLQKINSDYRQVYDKTYDKYRYKYMKYNDSRYESSLKKGKTYKFIEKKKLGLNKNVKSTLGFNNN